MLKRRNDFSIVRRGWTRQIIKSNMTTPPSFGDPTGMSRPKSTLLSRCPRLSTAHRASDANDSVEQHIEPVLEPALNEKVFPANMVGLWGKLGAFATLFFCMAFNNALLDATKDTLVIAHGGVELIPFLTLYVNLPSSILFVLIFSWLSSRMKLQHLFVAVVAPFLVFFGGFAAILYPMRDILHPHVAASAVMQIVPSGFAPIIRMFENWTFTLYYVMCELWGDVVLSLMFWQLANNSTSQEDAKVLYPLFGVGANIAQIVAGQLIKLVGTTSYVVSFADPSMQWQAQQNILMFCVISMGLVCMALYSKIVKAENERMLAMCINGETIQVSDELQESQRSQKSKESKSSGITLMDGISYLSNSPPLRGLTIVTLCQGVSQNLFEVAWKAQVSQLYPQPVQYSSFMGDVATASGVMTVIMMFASPYIFSSVGWIGAAGMTPMILTFGGAVFFIGAIIVHAPFSSWASYFGALRQPTAVVDGMLLWALAIGGGALYVFFRASKYALLKPAEEMVYIGLTAEERSKGKAAIDVVGTQVGKSGGSIVQQVLIALFLNINGCLPFMFIGFIGMVRLWNLCIRDLGAFVGAPSTAVK